MGSVDRRTRLNAHTLSPAPNMRSVYVVLAFASVVSAQFKCPKPDGTFEDGRQCDKYYECFDGIAEERLCPDGLVFDPFSNKREPCDHYFNVDCGDRLELQPPRGPNDLCPRLNGFYAHPDPAVCNIFYACVEGVAEEYTCSLKRKDHLAPLTMKVWRAVSRVLPLQIPKTPSAFLIRIQNTRILPIAPSFTSASME